MTTPFDSQFFDSFLFDADSTARADYGGRRVIRLRIEQQMDDEELMAIAAAMIPIIQADYMRQAA